jgi:hypothetical protein
VFSLNSPDFYANLFAPSEQSFTWHAAIALVGDKMSLAGASKFSTRALNPRAGGRVNAWIIE